MDGLVRGGQLRDQRGVLNVERQHEFKIGVCEHGDAGVKNGRIKDDPHAGFVSTAVAVNVAESAG